MDFGVHQNKLVIQLHTIAMYLFFAFSCINTATLLMWMIVLPIWLMKKYEKKGAIEFLIFLQFRSLLSSGIAVSFNGIAGIIKWAMIFIVSLYLIIGYSQTQKREIYNVMMWVMLFSVMAIISAWFSSSYPTIATFKIISYSIPFVAIIHGIAETDEIDWIRKINGFLGGLIFGSVVLLSQSIGYLRNVKLFQGVFNHPNVYAVLIAIFIAGYMYQEKIVSLKMLCVVSVATYLLYQTKSRTGMISLMIIIIIFLFTQEIGSLSKFVMILVVVLFLGGFLIINGSVIEGVEEFFYKGNSTDIFYSRNSQIQNGLSRFISNPLIGTGFNVPYIEGSTSYAFSFDLVTENGNLILALLGDVGIFGFILFCMTYTKIFKIGKGTISTIFFVPFIVCMGEMSFFSTNNFAIVLYMYFAIYMADGYRNRIQNEEVE